jgi:hypothetical protein
MYTYVAAILVAAACAATSAWQVQNWRFAAKEKERVEAQAETDRLAYRSRLQQQDRVVRAQNEAAARALAARNADRAAGDAVDRVRDEAAKSLDAARVSHEACIVNAAALKTVFSQCTGEYRALGATAQGHADDAKTLSDAWPSE